VEATAVVEVPAAFVDEAVVTSAEQHQVAERGRALAQSGGPHARSRAARAARGRRAAGEGGRRFRRRESVLGFHADALVVLAGVLRLSARPEEAAGALEEAIGLHERKGDVGLAAKARTLLESAAAVS
jgi:hypothetical protein